MGDGTGARAREVFDAFSRRVEAGEPVDFSAICERYGELAEELRSLYAERYGDEETVIEEREGAPAGGAGVDELAAGGIEVGGEIARGGMGLVSQGFDPQLQRRVALKGLLPEHRSNDGLVRRFVDEAQITGQLEHPGIVPVHGLGTGADGSPYFVMKLVEGRTLAELLSARAGPEDELARFLGIFERVCEAVGYSHSRGVIHRDLKPANVMVGAFGEVLVADWGLAKVLGEEGGEEGGARGAGDGVRTSGVGEAGDASRTLEGDVVGTLRYMAPEQGRGMAGVDERSDVFSLGSILCELLTGEPAYRRATASGLLEQVRSGDLGPTLERIAAAPVEAELRGLASRCVAADPAERPRDAGEVGEALRAFLEAREERARQAELEAAAAQARAEEERQRAVAERRARRMTVVAAVLVVVAAVGGLGLWWWLEQAARERERMAEAEVERALEEVAGLLARAEAAVDTDVASWEIALQGVNGAQALLVDEVGEALRARVSERAAEAEAGLSAAAGAAAREERNRRVLARLEQVREGLIETGYQDGWGEAETEAEAGYGEAFAEFGIDLENQDPGEVLAAMVSSGVKGELTGYLDSWAGVVMAARRERDGGGGGLAERLMAVLVTVDDDALSRQVRETIRAGDVGALKNLADVVGPDTAPEVIGLLANGLRGFASEPGVGDLEAELLGRGSRWHPDDFWLALRNSGLLLARGDTGDRRSNRDFSAGGLHATVAQALRPGSVVATRRVGFYHFRRGDYEEAKRALERALAMEPGDGLAMSNLGMVRLAFGDHAGAVELLKKVVEQGGGDVNSYARVGYALRKAGDFDGALEWFGRALEVDPEHADTHIRVAALWMDRSEWEPALASVQRAREIDAEVQGGRGNEAYILIQQGRLAEAEAVLREGLERDAGDVSAGRKLAVVLSMRGDAAGLAEFLPDLLRHAPEEVDLWCELAGSLAESGETGQAVFCFRQALALDRGRLAEYLGDLREAAAGGGVDREVWVRVREALVGRDGFEALFR